MSWWTKARDAVERVATAGLYNPEASRAAEREQRAMIAQQIKAYKDQTELTRKQLDETRAATMAEKRRVEQKQIRGLRSNYRAPNVGLLGVGTDNLDTKNNQLGG